MIRRVQPATAIGVDIGGTKILAARVRSGASTVPEILEERRVPTPPTRDALLDAIVGVVQEMRGDHAVAGVGVGLPGFVGLDGIARRAPHLAAIVGLDVGGPVGRRTGLPVHVDNDANCAAWAARALDAPAARSVVAVTLGTGIGAGLVVDGRMVRGANGFAGEPGHMIVDPDGPLCDCGQHGCWEVWASGAGVGRLARRSVEAGTGPSLLAAAGGRPGALDGEIVGRLAAAGDPAALAVLDRHAWWVSLGLVNLVNLLDPEVVILSGGIVEEGDALLTRIHGQMAGFPSLVEGRTLDLRLSSVGPAAGALGAALVALAPTGM